VEYPNQLLIQSVDPSVGLGYLGTGTFSAWGNCADWTLLWTIVLLFNLVNLFTHAYQFPMQWPCGSIQTIGMLKTIFVHCLLDQFNKLLLHWVQTLHGAQSTALIMAKLKYSS